MKLYTEIYTCMCVCVCVTRLSVVKCQTRVFFLIGKVKGESTSAWECDRAHDHAGEDTCATQEIERERTGN